MTYVIKLLPKSDEHQGVGKVTEENVGSKDLRPFGASFQLLERLYPIVSWSIKRNLLKVYNHLSLLLYWFNL